MSCTLVTVAGFLYLKFMKRLLLPLLQSTQGALPSLLHVLFSYLFINQFFLNFFSRVWVRLSRGLFWFITVVAVGITRAAYLLTCFVCISQAG
jgi:hypothetical protein